MSKKVILCVEDNIQVQGFNKKLLEANGYTVKQAMTLAGAREELAREVPCLIILDIHLPDGNGLDFLRKLRKTSNVPVIALTNNAEETDIVTGLQSGCDDYVPKPYTFRVLHERIKAILRRSASMPDLIDKGALKLYPLAGQAFLNDEDLLLGQKEFSLLLFFVRNEGKTSSADYIYENVWKQPMSGDDSALKNIVYRLRKKIVGSGYSITNVRGKGYGFVRE